MNEITRVRLKALHTFLGAKRRDYSAQCDQRIAVGLDVNESAHLSQVFSEWEDALEELLESTR